MRVMSCLVLCLLGSACATTSGRSGPGSRLPDEDAFVAAAREQPWGQEMAQIPATVIETGALASIPYLSHASAEVELNVYGDPRYPGAVEVGTKSTDPVLRESIFRFVADRLDPADRALLLELRPSAPGRVERAGMVLEVTFPEAPDAYGAWWVTVTHSATLAASRATREELAQLVEPAPQPRVVIIRAAPRVGFRPWTGRGFVPSYRRAAGVYVRHRRH